MSEAYSGWNVLNGIYDMHGYYTFFRIADRKGGAHWKIWNTSHFCFFFPRFFLSVMFCFLIQMNQIRSYDMIFIYMYVYMISYYIVSICD